MPPRGEMRPNSFKQVQKDVHQIVHEIVAKENYELLVQRASEWGKQLKEQELRMAQVRRVFGEVKHLQMQWEPNRLRMLRPRLAYVAARAGRGGQLLRDILTPAIDAVFQAPKEQQPNRFKVMVDLFEAVLAYYTEAACVGRDKNE